MCHGLSSIQHFTIFAFLSYIQGSPTFLKSQIVFITLHSTFLFPASFNTHSSKAIHTTHLKSLTDHLLLIRGGKGTENFPWDLTFFAWMKNCYSERDCVISLVTGAYSRSLLHWCPHLL